MTKQNDEFCEAIPSHFLSPAEHAVLSVFRKYLMTPGKMLCFAGAELESFGEPLAELIGKNLLVEERFQGGYSLTETGFATMKTGLDANSDA